MFPQTSQDNLLTDDTVMLALVPTWDAGEETRMLSGVGQFTIGSDRGCEVRVLLNGVAPRHCDIYCQNTIAKVIPRPGCQVWINQSLASRPQTIKAGDHLTIGPATFSVEHRRHGITVRANSRVRSAATGVPVTPHADEISESLPQPGKTPGHASRRRSDLPVKRNEMSERERSLLDAREQQLLNWQDAIEQRSAELDERSTRIVGQQTQMLQRQSQFEQRAAEIEAEQKAAFERLSERRVKADQSVIHALAAREAELKQLEASLHEQQTDLQNRTTQLQQLADTLAQREAALTADRSAAERQRQSILSEIDETRHALNDERHAFVAQQAELAERLRGLESDMDAFQRLKEETEQHNQRIVASAEEQHAELHQLRAELLGQETELRLRHENVRREKDEVVFAAEQAVADRNALNQLRDELTTKQDRHAAELLAGRNELSERERLLAEEQAACADLEHVHNEIKNARAELNRAEIELTQRTAELDEQVRELANNRDQVAEQSGDIEDARHDLRTAQEQLDAEKHQLELRQQSVADTENAVANREASVMYHEDALQKREADLESREAELAGTLCTIEHQAQETQQEAARLVADSLELDEERAHHAHNISNWQQQTAGTEKALRIRAEGLNRLEVELQRRAEELSDRAERLHTAVAEVEQNAEIHAGLESRQSALIEWEAEIESRHREVARRVTEFKRMIAEQQDASTRGAGNSDSEESDVAHQAGQALAETQSELESVIAERNDLSTALTELKAAFESLRAELMSRHDAELAADSNRLKDVQKHEERLSELNEVLEQKTRDAQSLEEKLQAITELLESERSDFHSRLEEASALSSGVDSSETEVELLRQVEELRTQLKSGNQSATRADVVTEVDKYERMIDDLTTELDTARQQLRDHIEHDDSGAEHLQLMAELKERLEECERENRSLREDTTTTHSKGKAGGGDQLNTLHRELDTRTIVLDTREEELRERTRMVEQSEGKIESQRRELLEARQRLELARAEIQVAMEKETTAPSEDIVSEALSLRSNPLPAPETATQNARETGKEQDTSASSPKVRSELAELFGIGHSESKTAGKAASDLPAVDDYSQETAAAVSMSFSHAKNVLLEAPTHEENEETADNAEEGEDFVAKYMEQLLARNRQNAGGSLPQELTKPQGKKQSAASSPAPAEKKAEAKKGPKTKSFIDAYMSGEFGETTVTNDVPAVAARSVERDPAQPRQKIDLEALRSDMNSFRQLSTKSVENALASHAKRQERGGISARVTILTVLGLVCFFMISAALMDVIQFGVTVWISIIAVAVSGAELAVKFWFVNLKVRQSSAALSQGKGGEALTSSLADTSASANESTLDTAAAPEAVPQSALPLDDAEPEDDKYFEL